MIGPSQPMRKWLVVHVMISWTYESIISQQRLGKTSKYHTAVGTGQDSSQKPHEENKENQVRNEEKL